MALRARFGPVPGESPFRVVGPGGSLATPNLSDVIFDANHIPLRVLQIGAMIIQSPGAAIAATTPGQNAVPLAIVFAGRPFATALMYPMPGGSGMGIPFFSSDLSSTPASAAGCGVATTSSQLYGLNWFHAITAGGGGFTQRPLTLSYVAFRNKVQ